MAEPITKSPEEMTDDELDAYLNGEDVVEKPDESPEQGKPEAPEDEEKPEDKPEEKPAEDEEEPEKPEDKPEDEEEKPVSRREQLRVNQLLERIKSESGGKPQEKPSEKPKPEGLKYEDELDADEETLQKLNDDREQYAEKRYQQGLEQAKALEDRQNAFEFRQMLASEEPIVLQKYPFLDSKSPEFDEQIATALVSKYFQDTGFDAETKTAKNHISYLEYAEAQIELSTVIAEKMARETQENVTRQAGQTGLRPSGSTPSKSLNLNKAPEDMTDEELDAIIAQSVPPRR